MIDKKKTAQASLKILATLVVSTCVFGILYGCAAAWPAKLNPITKLNDIDKYIIEVLGKEPTKYNRMEEIAKAWDQLIYIIIAATVVSLVTLGVVAGSVYQLKQAIDSPSININTNGVVDLNNKNNNINFN